jgi:hypothetical protein
VLEAEKAFWTIRMLRDKFGCEAGKTYSVLGEIQYGVAWQLDSNCMDKIICVPKKEEGFDWVWNTEPEQERVGLPSWNTNWRGSSRWKSKAELIDYVEKWRRRGEYLHRRRTAKPSLARQAGSVRPSLDSTKVITAEF